MKKNNFYLSIAAIILSVTFIFSLFNNNFSKDKRKPVKTALVNPKYKDSINQFLLQKGNDILLLQKKDDFWLVGNNQNSRELIPADTVKIENFLKDLTKVINMYKITDSLPRKNEFGLNDNDTFCIKYNENELYFGNYDFSKTSRYLMTGKNLNVYEIDTSFDKYLSTLIQTWSDPYIISKSIKNLKSEDIQRVFGIPEKDFNFNKLLELRHGGAGVKTDSQPALFFTLECGDTSEIRLRFFQIDESNYSVNVLYDLPLSSKKYEYNLKISLWTYNKIKEIML